MDNYSSVKKVMDLLCAEEVYLYEDRGGRPTPCPLEKDRVYIIPRYQREIKWQAGNVQTLIDDLKEGKKFLGTVTMSTNSIRQFEVIDGQQRLTVMKMLITYLNGVVPENKRFTSMCTIQNNSFLYFEEALKYGFDYETIQQENYALYDNIKKNDPLNQAETYKNIWNSIKERIEAIEDSDKKIALLQSLKESEVNVIVNKIDATDTDKKFCVDYFIDINNKNFDLECLDIIRAYAFKEDFDEMANKWIAIQDKCNAIYKNAKYTRETLYYQYFICKINEQLDYQITKLSEKYTIKEDVTIKNQSYSEGTCVWTMFVNDRFYAQLLNDLISYLDFIILVLENETGGFDEFKKYFVLEDGSSCDEVRIHNAHTIISSILRNDDIVPKTMIMKYFLDVLEPAKSSNRNYKLIYNINFIAMIFSAKTKRKGSELLSSKILSKEWGNALVDYSYRMAKESLDNIDFAKIQKVNKAYTIESGQYMARRYFTAFDSYSWASGNLSIDEAEFKKNAITNGTKNEEHFLVNRSYDYALYMPDGSTVDIEIKAPARIKKYIATIANYLVMDCAINDSLKNRPVYEKIKMLEAIIEQEGIDNVLPSKRSQLHYVLIKKIFFDNSHYPKEELEEATKKTDKKKILKEYYNKYFEDEFKELTDSLNNKEKMFEVAMQEELKAIGFVDVDGSFEFESDSTTITAEIDEKERKVYLRMEIYNPVYGEENGEQIYEEYIEKLSNMLKEKDKREFCLSDESLGCEDYNYTLTYCLPARSDIIVKYKNIMTEVMNNCMCYF